LFNYYINNQAHVETSHFVLSGVAELYAVTLRD